LLPSTAVLVVGSLLFHDKLSANELAVSAAKELAE